MATLTRNLTKVIQSHMLQPRLASPSLLSVTWNANSLMQQRWRVNNKHWNPKFKKLRRLKVIKVELPKYNEDLSTLTPDEMKARMKERGILPMRQWIERPFYISCTGGTFEPYVPPEGDGKISPITMSGAKQRFVRLEKKGKSMMAVRKIRNFDEDFDPYLFAQAAQEIYIQSHVGMQEKDRLKITECVTEKAYPLIVDNTRDKTIRWQFIKSLEPPRVVHVRCTNVITRDNIFGQITVRFHTKQTLAVYDRFGRLMLGSEVVAKDVLEYVVFEKHLSNQYGTWRIHDKIIPDWMPPTQPVEKTFFKRSLPPLEIEEGPKTSEVVSTEQQTTPEKTPVIAT